MKKTKEKKVLEKFKIYLETAISNCESYEYKFGLEYVHHTLEIVLKKLVELERNLWI